MYSTMKTFLLLLVVVSCGTLVSCFTETSPDTSQCNWDAPIQRTQRALTVRNLTGLKEDSTSNVVTMNIPSEGTSSFSDSNADVGLFQWRCGKKSRCQAPHSQFREHHVDRQYRAGFPVESSESNDHDSPYRRGRRRIWYFGKRTLCGRQTFPRKIPLARAHLCSLRAPSSPRPATVASCEGALLPIVEIAGFLPSNTLAPVSFFFLQK